ncbi:MAG: PucR family transcriptional regulator [bacterium]
MTTTTRTLRGLCDAVGDVLDVVVAPRGLDSIPVTSIALHDPLDTPGAALSAGDVVLAVGFAGYDAATAELIRAAGSAGAAAVVLRRRDEPSDAILRAAQEADLALLAVGRDMPWSELDGLLGTWLAASNTSALPGTMGAVSTELHALADATAEAAGGPVTIEDMHGRVLAFSGDQEVDPVRAATVLQRHAPDELMRQLRHYGILKQLLSTDDIVDVRLPGVPPRRAMPVRARGTVVGVIWLATRAGGATATADSALRDGARIAALHLTRQQVYSDLQERVRSGLLKVVLDGRGDPEAALDQLDVPRDSGLVLLSFAVEHTAAQEPQLAKLLERLRVHLSAHRWRAAGAILDDRAYLLVAVRDEEAARRLRTTVDDCLARVRRQLSGVHAGMSEWLADCEEIPGGRRDADRAVDLGESVDRIVPVDEVHSRALIADVRDFLGNQRLSRSRPLRALVKHDAENGTAYVPTLRSFLDAESDSVVASSRLDIHVNTLRYRIRRIFEIAEADLSDPDTRLALELELRVLGDSPGTGRARRTSPRPATGRRGDAALAASDAA